MYGRLEWLHINSMIKTSQNKCYNKEAIIHGLNMDFQLARADVIGNMHRKTIKNRISKFTYTQVKT